MANPFFEHPILNSPYHCPDRYWELDADGQPTQQIIENRRRADFMLLTTTFEGHAQHTESGVEYWLVRDVQHLLGYAEWRNFSTVISKAKTACEVAGHAVVNHFVDVNKMVDLGFGSQREIADIIVLPDLPKRRAGNAGQTAQESRPTCKTMSFVGRLS